MPIAVIAAALFVASLVVGGIGGGPFPSPYDSTTDVLGFFADHRTTVRVLATLQFASAVPLGILSAALVSRLQFLGFGRVPGTLIALTGGILAAGLLLLGAVVAWVLSRPEVAADRAVVRPLADLAFAIGGPAHVVCLGLLVAGLAVPSAIGRLLPRGLALAGVGVAAIAELSTLALVSEPAALLLPLARFGALAWLIAAAALLPVHPLTPNPAPEGNAP
ncbi:MAG: hypothetical protein QOK21_1781 [Solirubrobacteraceae bacterium]|nr:hypothetical protein [Solirubrobacteraceae bacterium]